MAGRDWLMSTERLRFGVWREDDMALALAIWGDPEVTALIGGPFSPDEVAERLAREIDNWRTRSIQYWPLFRRDDGGLAGACGLQPHPAGERTAELGFQLCRASWGQGLATEASRAVISWARAHGYDTLFAGHHPENHASRRTIIGLGFTYTHDEYYPPTGAMEPAYFLHLGDS